MNPFLWRYNALKSRGTRSMKMACGNSGGKPALKEPRRATKRPQRRLRVLRHPAIVVAYYQPRGKTHNVAATHQG